MGCSRFIVVLLAAVGATAFDWGTDNRLAEAIVVVGVLWLGAWYMYCSVALRLKRLRAADRLREATDKLITVHYHLDPKCPTNVRAAHAMRDYDDAVCDELGLPRPVRAGLSAEPLP